MYECCRRWQKLPKWQFQVRGIFIICPLDAKNIWSFSSNSGSKSYARLKVPYVSTKVVVIFKLMFDLWLNILNDLN